MNELLPLLQQLPRQVVDDAIAASAATPDMMLEQTAAVFTKAFYVQLGADTDAIRTVTSSVPARKCWGWPFAHSLCHWRGFCLCPYGCRRGPRPAPCRI